MHVLQIFRSPYVNSCNKPTGIRPIEVQGNKLHSYMPKQTWN